MRKSQTAKLQLWNVCMNYNYILTNMCACEKFWENWRFSNVYLFFEILPQLFATPKKSLKNNAPIFETRIYEYGKKGFSVRQQKSLIDVILYFCIFGFFPTILLMY